MSPSIAGPHAAVSASGALVIADTPPSAVPQLAWSAESREEAIATPDRVLDAVALPSDGSRLAGTESSDGATADIWIADLGRGTTSRVTTGARAAGPVWGGDSLFYAARDRGAYEIWRKDTDLPTTIAARIHSSPRHSFPVAVSPDGSALAFLQRGEATGTELWLLPLDGGSPSPVVQTPFEEGAAAFSGDGRFSIRAPKVAAGMSMCSASPTASVRSSRAPEGRGRSGRRTAAHSTTK